jgi:hypothetical protein
MIVLNIVLAYLIIGLAFSVPFLSKWIHAVDESTSDSSVGFKILILPGVIVFWPLLLKKVLTVKKTK